VTWVRLLPAVICHPYDYLKWFISNLAMVKNSHSSSVIQIPNHLSSPIRSSASADRHGRHTWPERLCVGPLRLKRAGEDERIDLGVAEQKGLKTNRGWSGFFPFAGA
jgi:hypothetical protein